MKATAILGRADGGGRALVRACGTLAVPGGSGVGEAQGKDVSG